MSEENKDGLSPAEIERQNRLEEIKQRLINQKKSGDPDNTGRFNHHHSDGRSLHDPEPENRQAQLEAISQREQEVLRRIFPEIPAEDRGRGARQLRELSIGVQGGVEGAEQPPGAAKISTFQERDQKLAEIKQRLRLEQGQRKRGRNFGLER